MVKELFSIALQHAPDRKWHVDTLLTMVERAPAHVCPLLKFGLNDRSRSNAHIFPLQVPEDLVPAIVQILADSPDYHGYIGQKCYNMLKNNAHDTALCQVASWCVGEFGDTIFGGSQIEPPFEGTSTELLDLLNKVLTFPAATATTRQVALTAVMKLSSRIPSELGRIRTMIGSYADNVQLELQQRSVE